MKVTRLLPKRLAIEFQRHDIERKETELKYYRARVFVLEQLVQERYEELEKLEGTSR
ncbi:hypothetical protein NsoK4_08180 [Nitrosopumilus sp. K4]|uniref:hypothetical protein n=1 Tax=Nitrosopumilus sp. K4 TaxID=2795383 RepID=UPI001BA7DD6E|nr:hypothetical protein [Nitrosopumilus sp. K4]QUC64393.1 hypothetical protein NsoK4_08180 [Nitrosopumilus sp. K4]